LLVDNPNDDGRSRSLLRFFISFECRVKLDPFVRICDGLSRIGNAVTVLPSLLQNYILRNIPQLLSSKSINTCRTNKALVVTAESWTTEHLNFKPWHEACRAPSCIDAQRPVVLDLLPRRVFWWDKPRVNTTEHRQCRVTRETLPRIIQPMRN